MRVKGGKVRHRRHKKILKATKGYRMTKNSLYKVAHEAYLHAKQYAYNDRQRRPSQMKRVWVDRISSASRNFGTSYREFMFGLKTHNVKLNKKMLADIAYNRPELFGKIVDKVSKK
jgi:large subunit ribosomal protein L20